jgi:hypothetical protein
MSSLHRPFLQCLHAAESDIGDVSGTHPSNGRNPHFLSCNRQSLAGLYRQGDCATGASPSPSHERHEEAGPIGADTVPRGNLNSHEMDARVLRYGRRARSLFGYRLMCQTVCFRVPRGCQDFPVHISKTRGSDRMHSVSGCGVSSLRFILQR